jgi:2-(1,2-epoxy-1,2-dihydrophenyl)acetyl-CoA isomerase
MIYKAIADVAFEHYVAELATQLAQMPTTGFGLTKKAVNAALCNTLENQLALEEQLQTQAGQTQDFKEGVAAFLEKRKPEFKGN